MSRIEVSRPERVSAGHAWSRDEDDFPAHVAAFQLAEGLANLAQRIGASNGNVDPSVGRQVRQAAASYGAQNPTGRSPG